MASSILPQNQLSRRSRTILKTRHDATAIALDDLCDEIIKDFHVPLSEAGAQLKKERVQAISTLDRVYREQYKRFLSNLDESLSQLEDAYVSDLSYDVYGGHSVAVRSYRKERLERFNRLVQERLGALEDLYKRCCGAVDGLVQGCMGIIQDIGGRGNTRLLEFKKELCSLVDAFWAELSGPVRLTSFSEVACHHRELVVSHDEAFRCAMEDAVSQLGHMIKGQQSVEGTSLEEKWGEVWQEKDPGDVAFMSSLAFQRAVSSLDFSIHQSFSAMRDALTSSVIGLRTSAALGLDSVAMALSSGILALASTCLDGLEDMHYSLSMTMRKERRNA